MIYDVINCLKNSEKSSFVNAFTFDVEKHKIVLLDAECIREQGYVSISLTSTYSNKLMFQMQW